MWSSTAFKSIPKWYPIGDIRGSDPIDRWICSLSTVRYQRPVFLQLWSNSCDCHRSVFCACFAIFHSDSNISVSNSFTSLLWVPTPPVYALLPLGPHHLYVVRSRFTGSWLHSSLYSPALESQAYHFGHQLNGGATIYSQPRRCRWIAVVLASGDCLISLDTGGVWCVCSLLARLAHIKGSDSRRARPLDAWMSSC